MHRGRPLALFLALLLLPLTALAQPGPEGPPVPDVPAVAEQPAVAVTAAATLPSAPPSPVVLPVAVVPVADVAMPPVVIPATPPPAPEPSIWQGLGGQVLSYVVPIAGSLLSVLGAWLLLLLKKRLNLNIDVTRDSMLRSAIRAAIAGAEEWAARRLKTGQKTDSHAKLQWVVDALIVQYPKLLPDDLKRTIDEELGLMPGAGATGDRAIGLGVLVEEFPGAPPG